MSISGTWYNELGSQMDITASGAYVYGTYDSGVGTSGSYILQGMVDSAPSGGSQAAGWVVAWNNAYGNLYSLTSWAGQYQIVEGNEEIVALWLLVEETSSADDWKSTLVGQDTFTRTQLSKEEVARNRKRVAPSHPTNGKRKS